MKSMNNRQNKSFQIRQTKPVIARRHVFGAEAIPTKRVILREPKGRPKDLTFLDSSAPKNVAPQNDKTFQR